MSFGKEVKKTITERFNENRKKATLIYPEEGKKIFKKVMDKLNDNM
jgi:hypothetical protein